jgi:hypothetical protein
VHIDVTIFPPLLSKTSVTSTGQTRLQIPHLVHFTSCFSKCSAGNILKQLKRLSALTETPVGQNRHQNLLTTKAAANVVATNKNANLNAVSLGSM